MAPAPQFLGGPGPYGACQARQLYLRLLSVTCRSPGAGPEMPTSSSSATGEWQLSPVPWAGVLRVACGTSTSLTISTKDRMHYLGGDMGGSHTAVPELGRTQAVKVWWGLPHWPLLTCLSCVDWLRGL